MGSVLKKEVKSYEYEKDEKEEKEKDTFIDIDKFIEFLHSLLIEENKCINIINDNYIRKIIKTNLECLKKDDIIKIIEFDKKNPEVDNTEFKYTLGIYTDTNLTKIIETMKRNSINDNIENISFPLFFRWIEDSYKKYINTFDSIKTKKEIIQIFKERYWIPSLFIIGIITKFYMC